MTKTTYKQTCRFEAVVDAPCAAEVAYIEDLATLPESSPENLMRSSGMAEAMRRLSAARLVLEEAELDAKEAGRRLRAMVQRDWKESEIPKAVKDALRVW